MRQSVRGQLNVSVGMLMVAVCTSTANAQQHSTPATASKIKTATPTLQQPVWQQASNVGGRVQGIVRDDRGAAVDGVRISAIGTTTQAAWTDRNGRFVLPLPAGEYILRAQRDGYSSSYRDMVMVRASSAIEKTITVTKQPGTGARPIMVAGVSPGPFIPSSAVEPDPDHPHDETAWRLRHIKRPILRDTGTTVADAARSQNFRPETRGFLDWAILSSARAASSFITGTDFTGQVNFVTTSAVDAALGWSQPEGPRSVAYISLSAPVGALGDWRVRGAMNTADLSSWVVLGEFTARQTRTHAFSVGMDYSTQTYAEPAALAFSSSTDPATTRSVGGVYGSDRWRVSDGIDLDYGMRWDRYSYIANAPNMVSPRIGGRVHVARGLSVVGEVAQRMVAPGSTEFLPPAAAGPWLPPERTFSSLSSSGTFRAERVRHGDIGIEQRFKDGAAISVRKFRQTSDDQTATIFGIGGGITGDRDISTAGHYSVASIGAVEIDGWVLRASGSLSPRVSGSIEYTTGHADWTSGGSARRVALLAPAAVRVGADRIQDLLASIELAIPESDTRIAVVYRVDSAFSRSGIAAKPGLGARFDMQVSQALPFQPLRGGRLEVLVAMSNLFRDLRQPGSLFDELLTVAPPTRLLGGVQLRF